MRCKLFFFVITLWLGVSQALATHIVGGELTYKCLGNNDYEIKLTIFRDCYNGNPNAWFDNPASVGVFNSSNQLVSSLSIPLGNINDTLQPVLDNPCLVIPPDVCVHTTTYTDTINLPFLAGGYQLAYQRCCRNGTIVNIVSPLATGVTFYSYISEAALLQCNTAAVFNDWPPLYICVNEPISFDHSAFDSDGDSLVYELCVPFSGASQFAPIPQPPNAPPYNEVVWVSPTYSVNNMLGGTALAINQETGMLSGTPNTIGQFVVGVCVKEFRNDTLISLTKRDFQYNVGVCGQVVSSIGNSETWCDSLTVEFENESINASHFHWDFGIDGIETDTSTAFEPNYIYPDTGYYTVRLIAISEETACSDTTFFSLYIQPSSIYAEFSIEALSCNENDILLAIQNLSYDNIHGILSYQWYENGNFLSYQEQPSLSVPLSDEDEIQLSLVVQSNNGCIDSFHFYHKIEVFNYPTNQEYFLCKGYPLVLNENPTGENLAYHWSPEALFENPNEASQAFIPEEDIVVTLSLTDTIVGCMEQYPIAIQLQPSIDYYLPIDTAQCDSLPIDIFIQHDYADGELVTAWAFQNLDNNYVAFDTDSLSIPFGIDTVIVVMGHGSACTYHYIFIKRENLAIETQDFTICPNEPLTLDVGGEDYYTYQWSPATALSASDIPNPICTTEEDITYNLNVSFPEGNCSFDYPINVNFNSPSFFENIGDTLTCDNVLNFNFSDELDTINWIIQGNTNYTFSGNQLIINTDNGYEQTAFISINDENDCLYQDTFLAQFFTVSIDSLIKILPCNSMDSTFLLLENTFPEDWLLDYDFNIENEYRFNDKDSLWLLQDFPVQGTWSVTESVLACSDTAIIDISYAESLLDYELNAQAEPSEIILGEDMELSADYFSGLNYQWSPADIILHPTDITTPASPTKDTTFYLVAFDENGCFYEDSVNILLRRGTCDFPHIFIPNAFSPNGDNDNDILLVRGAVIETMDLKIFSEWGELVFQSQDIETGWNGQFNGSDAPVGVYGYVLELICANGEQLQKQGNITLVR